MTPYTVSCWVGVHELRSAITVMSVVKVTLPWMYSTELSNGICFIRDRTAILIIELAAATSLRHRIVTPPRQVLLAIRNRILFSTSNRSLYSDCLRAGRSGDRIPVEARFSAPLQTGPEAHPASCTMGTGSFPGVRCGGGVTLTPHSLLVSRSKIE
jgi:hypothetical protein